MPVKTNLTKEIKCRCKKDTVVDCEPATAYCQMTRFQCDCGRVYHITDYMNGITTYREVSAEEDETYLKKMKEEERRKKKFNPTNEGIRKYRAVEKWLNAQSVEFIAGVEHQRTFHQMIDKDFVIETLLESCRYEDDLLDELYQQYILSLYSKVEFHASGNQAFTDKKDWYIIEISDGIDAKISRPYSSKADASAVRDKLTEDTDNCDKSYAVISVPFGSKVTL
jgi:hypothetical protein